MEKANTPKTFFDATIYLSENGWVIQSGRYGERAGHPDSWIAKTPQEIADIFIKYAVKPALYKGSKT
jgi:hypothetical protein